MEVADIAVCTDGVACEPGTPSRCDGNFVVACQLGNLEKRVDCGLALPGGTCVHIESHGGVATLCVHDGAACAPASFPARCEGDVAITCPFGREQRLDCASAESTCRIMGSTGPECAPVATDCSEGSPDRCAGDALEVCVNGHYLATACAELGFRTCMDDGSGARCVL
jgi:hypothetical protein